MSDQGLRNHHGLYVQPTSLSTSKFRGFCGLLLILLSLFLAYDQRSNVAHLAGEQERRGADRAHRQRRLAARRRGLLSPP